MNKQQYDCIVRTAFEHNKELPESFRQQIFFEGLRELNRRPTKFLDRKILLIGGSGYIGTVLTKHLLDYGYKVRCLDLLLYENHGCVIPSLLNKNYEFIWGDFTQAETINMALNEITDVVILAGLVGDPVTKKYPSESNKINHDGMLHLIDILNNRNLNKVIFISTCSNYGIVPENKLADENTPLSPLSLYAKAKVAIEEQILSSRGKLDYFPTILRFSTAFGLSPRMRFDLTVNQFVYDFYQGEDVLVYDPDTWRPYCHVMDFSLIVRRVLEAPLDLINFEIFNAGGEKNNYTKRMLVNEIKQYLPNAKFNFQAQGSDPRDYRVSFKKIKEKLYFEPTYAIADGVKEILGALNQNIFLSENVKARKNFYENHQINYLV